MGSLVEAGKASELQQGTMKDVSVNGREILLAKVGDKYYATDNLCPHMGGKLSQGKLEGTVVTCPLHGSQFDISNGQVVRWLKGSGIVSAVGRALKSPRQLTIYNIKVEDDRVMIEI
ncbi:MAG TPA: Rieske 2Fe-2S domain-containing protein [Dehalococcoidia bacterium]|nr:Rieske 2Fe-2S domain-containing protein [Dehalococcoidia bacterium]